MNLNALARFFSLLACCALAGAATAPATQPASDLPPVPAEPVAAAQATTQPLRDPTQIDPALAQALGGAGARNLVLQVTRQGLVAIAGKPTVALIEVQGAGSFFVREGSTLAASVDGLKVTVTVKTLTPDDMVLDVDSKSIAIVLR